jgi:Cytochrome c7 and related cytochrome c
MKDRLRKPLRYFATLRLCVNRFSRQDAKAQSTAKKVAALLAISFCITAIAAQTRRRPRPTQTKTQTQAPRGSAAKYSAFLHSSDGHKSLACNACHKVPTAWNAKRDFPDVADFPDHDTCVRCHRQQFFTRQVMSGTGPSICTVCHVRAAPREDERFAFGAPNNGNQSLKNKEGRELRQFTIEFPHDQHQNAIARVEWPRLQSVRSELHHRLKSVPLDDKKPDYNNCSICHRSDLSLAIVALPPQNADPAMLHPFKSMPGSHDACFNCHWKNLKPASDDCAGCHKLAPSAFTPLIGPKRISAKFAHEGGKGEHVMECTTCHINITRASTLRGLTPDVPIAACASCHKDSKKTTYPKAVTIEEEFAQNKKTGECTYCHTPDVGKKKPPPSHDAAAQ